MSIRAIAQDLYKCQSRIHTLEDLLQKAEGHEKDSLKEELRTARAELKILKNMIEGRKAQSTVTGKNYLFPFKR